MLLQKVSYGEKITFSSQQNISKSYIYIYIYIVDVQKVINLLEILDLSHTSHICINLTSTEIKTEVVFLILEEMVVLTQKKIFSYGYSF